MIFSVDGEEQLQLPVHCLVIYASSIRVHVAPSIYFGCATYYVLTKLCECWCEVRLSPFTVGVRFKQDIAEAAAAGSTCLSCAQAYNLTSNNNLVDGLTSYNNLVDGLTIMCRVV